MVTFSIPSLQIEEELIEIDNPKKIEWVTVYKSLLSKICNKTEHAYVIKVNLIKSTKSKLLFNLIFINNFKGFIDEPFLPSLKTPLNSSTQTIAGLIIPTGVGASYGGYAGDSNPLAKVIACTSEYLLTHPNVVNGAVLSDLPKNIIYLEGFLLDQFLVGKVNIIPRVSNKIGVIFDRSIDEQRLEYEVNALNALRAFYGCEICTWCVTDKPLVIKPEMSKYNFSTGTILHLDSLLDQAIKLKNMGVTAIAICCAIPDLELNKEYICGKGIDPIGGIESVISHAVSAKTGLVSAHAPVLVNQNENIDYDAISPVSASEYIAPTFLPSIISGLRYAPEIIVPKPGIKKLKNEKSILDLSVLIVPYNAFGSAGVFYISELLSNIVLIKENKTGLEINPEDVNFNFKILDNYMNVVGLEKIKELGIDPTIFKRPIEKITRCDL